MKKSELRNLIKKSIREQFSTYQGTKNIKHNANLSKKETVECIQDYECGSAGDNPQCCNSGFCGPCGASMGKHGANINENPSVDERKNVGGKKLMCCCAWSSGPMIVECINFDSCSDCCLIGTSSGCKGGAPVADFELIKKR